MEWKLQSSTLESPIFNSFSKGVLGGMWKCRRRLVTEYSDLGIFLTLFCSSKIVFWHYKMDLCVEPLWVALLVKGYPTEYISLDSSQYVSDTRLGGQLTIVWPGQVDAPGLFTPCEIDMSGWPCGHQRLERVKLSGHSMMFFCHPSGRRLSTYALSGWVSCLAPNPQFCHFLHVFLYTTHQKHQIPK